MILNACSLCREEAVVRLKRVGRGMTLVLKIEVLPISESRFIEILLSYKEIMFLGMN